MNGIFYLDVIIPGMGHTGRKLGVITSDKRYLSLIGQIYLKQRSHWLDFQVSQTLDLTSD